MDNLILAVNTVLPFLLYISFGYGVRAAKIVDEKFMNQLNGLIFMAFFPCTMFSNVYDIPEGMTVDIKLAVCAIASILIVIGLSMLIVPHLVQGNPQRGVIVQAIYRSNFVLFAIPMTEHVFGQEGGSLAAMMIAFVIPTYNSTAVMILEYYHGKAGNPLQLLKNILTNPLICGALTGVFFRVLHIPIPSPIYGAISTIGDVTTPIALFALGGTLHFSAVHGNLKYLVPTLTFKLAILPIFMLLASIALGLTPIERFMLFIMYATPVATSSFAMAKAMGGDGELAGQFVVFSTSFSIVTLFLWIFTLKTIGLI